MDEKPKIFDVMKNLENFFSNEENFSLYYEGSETIITIAYRRKSVLSIGFDEKGNKYFISIASGDNVTRQFKKGLDDFKKKMKIDYSNYNDDILETLFSALQNS
ncbi:MAG: hypothetical protein Fur0024_5290 [Patescibacteria group bacterium]